MTHVLLEIVLPILVGGFVIGPLVILGALWFYGKMDGRW